MTLRSHLLIFVLLAVLIVAFCVYRFVYLQPSQSRNWSPDLATLAHAEIEGDKVTVYNIRNFAYQTETEYTPRYYNKSFDLERIKKVYYAVVPFGSVPGIAHTFVSFEFEEDQFLAISIEVRKQVGEDYSIPRGLVKPYELIYVVGDENDIIKLRTNYRKGEDVHLYPVRARKEVLQAVFLDYMNRVNQLYAKPEFYNIFTKTCTTDIVDVVNRASGYRIPLSYKYFLPAFSDEYALEQGLLDTNLSIDEARAYFSINKRAQTYGHDPDFSLKIREPESDVSGS